MLVAPALHDKHAQGFARVAQTKPYKLCMLNGFSGAFATFVAPERGFCQTLASPLRSNLASNLQKKSSCVLKHGQPAQRTVFEAGFHSFSWVLDPSWSQLRQNGVPIELVMLAYSASARALYRNIINTVGGPVMGRFEANEREQELPNLKKHPS